MTKESLKFGMAYDHISLIRPAEAGLPADPGEEPEGGAFCVFGAIT